ncbi:MAG: tRNA (guanosine(37)-N1)-methyltransferase TrmD [Candidatus Nomurabacteria bacterium]|nr:MAG: tRNA (guanosine(37)-N1)-methyltransferase TrmD [Candidatus Nomurabacteria bacterium]
MKICYISLFPEVIEAYNNVGMMRKAQEMGSVEFIYLNLRDFGLGPRKQVDDTPYGGGDGMVLKPEPIAEAIAKAKELVGDNAMVILPTPRGVEFTQNDSNNLAELNENLIIFCSRYEGYDERITKLVDRQFFIGRYVLTGGEIPAMVISDSIIRLLDGVLGGEESAVKESFQTDLSLIEHPQYTRPEIFEGESIPEVLKGGNHAEIEKWRQENYIT